MFKQERDQGSLGTFFKKCLHIPFIDKHFNRESGEEVAPPRGGIKGKLQRLDSFTG